MHKSKTGSNWHLIFIWNMTEREREELIHPECWCLVDVLREFSFDLGCIVLPVWRVGDKDLMVVYECRTLLAQAASQGSLQFEGRWQGNETHKVYFEAESQKFLHGAKEPNQAPCIDILLVCLIFGTYKKNLLLWKISNIFKSRQNSIINPHVLICWT